MPLKPLRTPGVYIDEIPVFPPSVAEVETAIPAFVGYTEKAVKEGQSLTLKATKIYSLREYEEYFGFPPPDQITITAKEEGDKTFTVTDFAAPKLSYLLYFSMKMFYDNGGGPCYVVSVGPYATPGAVQLGGVAGTTGLADGLDEVARHDEPTLLVVPEAVNLSATDYEALVAKMLLQCEDLQDRFAVFDVYGGADELDDTELKTARDHFGLNSLKYAAAYYPFLKTSLHFYVPTDEKNVTVKLGTATGDPLVSLKENKTALYNTVKSALREHANSFVVLPPSPAVVGRYAFTDGTRGVWKAPAGMSVSDVVEPMVRVTHLRQGEFNVDSDAGKSINVLRAFAGKGTLVWGARTLAGNDNEWRYVPVRRFFNMVEESVKKSTYWAVFEPNDANTWVKVRGMIENYLTQKWREGALAGATTKDAFFVRCGLGTTMSAQDILEGKLDVEIGMAVVRPAEFIVLKFFHKLQTS